METKDMNIHKKLQQLRIDLNNKGLSKTGYNKHSDYEFWQLGDFLPQTQALCNEYGLSSKFDITNEEFEKVELLREVATLLITNIDKPEEQLLFKIPTAEVKIGQKRDGTGGAQAIQNLGGKVSYLRRYLWIVVVELSDNDYIDLTAKNGNDEEVQKEEYPTIVRNGESVEGCSLQQATTIKDYCEKHNIKDQVLAFYDVKKYTALTRVEAEDIINNQINKKK